MEYAEATTKNKFQKETRNCVKRTSQEVFAWVWQNLYKFRYKFQEKSENTKAAPQKTHKMLHENYMNYMNFMWNYLQYTAADLKCKEF